MTAEKFILVSLEDKKAKELANVISNDTSRKILDFLSDRSSTEGEIAKKLNLPASTVHYNVQNLLKQNLIEVRNFYWSEKGNKVLVYTVSKKLIVIAPKNMRIKTRLKDLIPVSLAVVVATAIIHFFTEFTKKIDYFGEAPKEQLMMASQGVMENSDLIVGTSARSVISATEFSEPNYALWFFFGSVFVIIVGFLINYLMLRKQK